MVVLVSVSGANESSVSAPRFHLPQRRESKSGQMESDPAAAKKGRKSQGNATCHYVMRHLSNGTGTEWIGARKLRQSGAEGDGGNGSGVSTFGAPAPYRARPSMWRNKDKTSCRLHFDLILYQGPIGFNPTT